MSSFKSLPLIKMMAVGSDPNLAVSTWKSSVSNSASLTQLRELTLDHSQARCSTLKQDQQRRAQSNPRILAGLLPSQVFSTPMPQAMTWEAPASFSSSSISLFQCSSNHGPGKYWQPNSNYGRPPIDYFVLGYYSSLGWMLLKSEQETDKNTSTMHPMVKSYCRRSVEILICEAKPSLNVKYIILQILCCWRWRWYDEKKILKNFCWRET